LAFTDPPKPSAQPQRVTKELVGHGPSLA
jgi:hypothetical protein